MKRLYVFDFDGTLTTADTLLVFIRYACGTWRFFWGFLVHSPLLVLMKKKVLMLRNKLLIIPPRRYFFCN